MGFKNKPPMDLGKTLYSESFSQGMEGVVGWFYISGDKAVKIVFPERPGQLPIRQNPFFDLNHAGQDQGSAIPFRACTGIGVRYWCDAVGINQRKILDE
jgi:hypothetical protein